MTKVCTIENRASGSRAGSECEVCGRKVGSIEIDVLQVDPVKID